MWSGRRTVDFTYASVDDSFVLVKVNLLHTPFLPLTHCLMDVFPSFGGRCVECYHSSSRLELEYAGEPVLALSSTTWGRWKRFAVEFGVCCVTSLDVFVEQDIGVCSVKACTW